jgi:photosystem II stability/assembly factor-like uncharacterized protein
MKIHLQASGFFCGLLVTVVCTSAQTWTQTSAPTNLSWVAVASAADGTRLAAVANQVPSGPYLIYASTNSGCSWNLRTNGLPPGFIWTSVACSADGSKLFAAPFSVGGIYVSTNWGTTWTVTNNLPNYRGTGYVAASADGSTLVFVAEAGVGIYVSTNSGASWKLSLSNSLTGPEWNGVFCSADGTKMAAEGGWTESTSRLVTSTNGGSSWEIGFSQSYPIQTGVGFPFCSDADGSKLFVFNADRSLLESTNWGATWSTNLVGFPYGWFCVACSGGGDKLLEGGGGSIWTSTDAGNTWTSNNAPNLNWWSVASSADGSKLVAADFNGNGIWTLQTTPKPQLNLASSGDGLALSWVVPSTNFVLQQNSDLTIANWVTLTNAPALNLSNLNDELVLSPSNSSGFFRLMAQ